MNNEELSRIEERAKRALEDGVVDLVMGITDSYERGETLLNNFWNGIENLGVDHPVSSYLLDIFGTDRLMTDLMGETEMDICGVDWLTRHETNIKVTEDIIKAIEERGDEDWVDDIIRNFKISSEYLKEYEIEKFVERT